MILKIYPNLEFEAIFDAKYKHFKSECLSFLKEMEDKDDFYVKYYEIENKVYTMCYHQICDKEGVFLMSGNHEYGASTMDTINQSIVDMKQSIYIKKERTYCIYPTATFKSIEHLFRAMDLNGDEFIDETEFFAMLNILGVDWKDSKTKKVFNQIDDEGNGKISIYSFMRFMMTPSNKSSWKELKYAINCATPIATDKLMKESSISIELYQKQLNEMQKLVNMMTESVMEHQLPSEEQQYWKNKIAAHREFIEIYLDAFDKEENRRIERLEKKQKDGDIDDVSAIGVFVNHQMILKVFLDQEMEGAFRATYKDFKSECLSFLKQVEEKDDNLEIRHYTISEPYTMFYSEVGDKEVVFLMAGHHSNGFPSTNALHQAVIGIINSIHGSNGIAGFSSIEQVFRTMDLNGNGTINDAEFTTGLGVLGVDWKDSKIKKLFNQIDEEGNGEISLDALMRFMMTPSNKSSWKELKSSINASIFVPTQKSIKKSSLSPELYHKKLSQMEKLVNMMEEAVVEQQLPSNEQQYWKNKILAHREFIRAHQDAVGKAMASDITKLKKRLNDLEKKNRRLSEFVMSMGIDPDDQKALKKATKKAGGKRSGSVQLHGAVGDDEDNQALLHRLRRDNEEFKRKIQEQRGDLRKLLNEKNERTSNTPRSASRRGSKPNLDDTEMEELMIKLKKENYEIRKERDATQSQLHSAKDRVKKLEALAGDDEDLLKQLYAARKEAKCQRATKRDLQKEALKLKGISNAQQRKLMALAKHSGTLDEGMGQRILEQTTANGMIDELSNQLVELQSFVEQQMEKEKMEKKKEREILRKKHEEKEKEKLKEEKKPCDITRSMELENKIEKQGKHENVLTNIKKKIAEWKAGRKLIDNVFADLENMFYCLSQLLLMIELKPLTKIKDREERKMDIEDYGKLEKCQIAITNILKIFIMPLIYLLIIMVALFVILPSCFFLLIVRMNKVEIKSDKVAKREKQLEKETKFEKFIRILHQLLRSSFMFIFLVIYPIIIIYIIIPYFGEDNDGAIILSISSYLFIILLLQMFGTWRGVKSFQERKKLKPNEQRYQPQKFVWNLGSIIAILLLFYEVFQLSFFSYQTTNNGEEIEMNQDETISFSADSLTFIDSEKILKFTNFMVRVCYLSLDFLENNRLEYYTFFSIIFVCLLILFFIYRFIYELKIYGRLRWKENKRKEAREIYFHSFIGTIIYGHGKLKNVNKWNAKIISLLADSFFLGICQKVILIISCDENQFLRIDPNRKCWQNEHKLYSLIALILFGYYIPICSMIAPMFQEDIEIEEEEEKKEKESSLFKQFVSFSNTIAYVAPYMSAFTVMECFMLISSEFISKGGEYGTIISQLIAMCALIYFTISWSFTDLNKYGLTQNEPIFPFGISIIKILAFFCGAIGCLLEILRFNNIIDIAVELFLLFVSIIMISIIFAIIFAKYHSFFNSLDDDIDLNVTIKLNKEKNTLKAIDLQFKQKKR